MLFAFVANTKLSNYFVCMLCTPNDPHMKYSNIVNFLANKCISCRIYMKEAIYLLTFNIIKLINDYLKELISIASIQS